MNVTVYDPKGYKNPRRRGFVFGRIWDGLRVAVGAKRKILLMVAVGIFALDTGLPIVLLSLISGPVDYVTINPLLPTVPSYVSGGDTLGKKLSFLYNLAILVFYVTGNVQYGAVRGITRLRINNLVLYLITSIIFGTYFALRSGYLDNAKRKAGRVGIMVRVISVLPLVGAPLSISGADIEPYIGSPLLVSWVDTSILLDLLADVVEPIVLVLMLILVMYVAFKVGSEGRMG